ncbi:MAG: phosphoribosylglycinamide formyltransferase [Ignavibacteriae bacterium]|nr:phosphoribosylglycinamide formyltransferase [Ignavibacteriota bacterium]
MNIAVFASGRGSNFEAILTAIKRGTLPARVVVLVSNKLNAGAMELARSHGIPAAHISEKRFSSEEEYVESLLSVLQQHHTDFIALAGYLKKIPRRVVERFRHKIVNIHPALLPKFGGPGMYGIHVHEAVLAAGETTSGATVHIVDEEYDRGAIVLQRTVNVIPGDTPETLAARVLTLEHELYPEALRAFAEGRVDINGTEAWIRPAASHRQST